MIETPELMEANDVDVPMDEEGGRAPQRRDPPNPSKRTRRSKKTSTPKPVPQPGKFKPVLDFNTFREQRSATMFTFDPECFQSMVNTVAAQSTDTLARMSVITVADRNHYLADVSNSLASLTRLAVAAKLFKTATPAERAPVSAYHSVFRQFDEVELPVPILSVIDRFGNFETATELWRVDGMAGMIDELIAGAATTPDPNQVRVTSMSSFHQQRARWESTLVDNPVYVDAAGGVPLRVPSDFDWFSDAERDRLAAILVVGNDLGQRGEFQARVELVRAFRTWREIPGDQAQNAFAGAFEICTGIPFRFFVSSVAERRRALAELIASYSLTHRDRLFRVWKLGSSSSFTDSGSPAQLLRMNADSTRAVSELPVQPTDFSWLSFVSSEAEVTRRPSDTWSTTQSMYSDSIQALLLDVERKTTM